MGHALATGESSRGWNWAVTFAAVLAPLGLVGIEYAIRFRVCEVVAEAATTAKTKGTVVEAASAAMASALCDPLEFFAPTMMAAALAIAIPCMLVSAHKPDLKTLPLAPSFFERDRRRKWKAQNRDAISWNRGVKTLRFLNLAIVGAAAMLGIAIFFLWLVALHPLEPAKLQLTQAVASASKYGDWGPLQNGACVVYAIAAFLTIVKFKLERPQHD